MNPAIKTLADVVSRIESNPGVVNVRVWHPDPSLVSFKVDAQIPVTGETEIFSCSITHSALQHKGAAVQLWEQFDAKYWAWFGPRWEAVKPILVSFLDRSV